MCRLLHQDGAGEFFQVKVLLSRGGPGADRVSARCS